jgi:thiamine kinase-like enzyme
MNVTAGSNCDHGRVRSLIAENLGSAQLLALTTTPLSGGLDSCGVFRVEASAQLEDGRKTRQLFVVKQVRDSGLRELRVYQALRESGAEQLAPRLLGSRRVGRSETYLLLEYIQPACHWPWRSEAATSSIIQQLLVLHSLSTEPFEPIFWETGVEAELQESAATTAEWYGRSLAQSTRPGSRPMMKALERVVADLPAIRRHLFRTTGIAVLHGDVHTANVVLRDNGIQCEGVLLDWGRARLGSPLEDVASWLHSLGYWEPEARRLHDTFLRGYLESAGLEFDREMRRAYWLAAASNAMAGALRYHLTTLLDRRQSEATRAAAERAAVDWLRVIRRADDYWRTGGDNRQIEPAADLLYSTAAQ